MAISPRAILALSLLLQCSEAFNVRGGRSSSIPAFAATVPRSRVQLSRYSDSNRSARTSLQGKKDDSDDEGSNNFPFFARLAKKITRMSKEEVSKILAAASVDEDIEEGGVAVVVKDEEEKTKDEHQAAAAQSKSPSDVAAELKLQAERARLEAQKMDTMLTIEKLSKLQKKLESKGLKSEEEKDIRSQINVLKTKLDGPKETSPVAAVPSKPAEASPPSTSMDEDISSLITPKDPKENASTSISEDDIPPISEKELKERSEAFLKTPKVLQQMTAAAAGFKDTSNVTGIIKQMHKDEQIEILKKKQREGKKAEPLDDEAREQALDGYMQLPLPIQDMIARSAGLENGRNATDVIKRLEKEGRLFPSENGMEAGFEVTTDVVDSSEIDVIFKDMEKMEKDKYIESMMPAETRKVEGIPTDEDINVFFTQVLSNRNFNPSGKPENIPGGFLIRGENKMKTGDELVATLDNALVRTNISEKVQFYYMKDPNPSTEEQFQNYENDLPVIVVTGRDISPETKLLTKSVISLLGIVFVASFSIGALSFNTALVDRLDAEVQAGTADLSWIQTLAAPTFFAICVTQLVHEASHQAVAFKDKFKAGLPTIVPSLQTGLSGAVTPLKSSPPNLNSLFDFSMAGPLSGLIISLFFMYSGLELTAFMGPEAQSQLPSLPVQLARSSALAGGMVEWLLGEGILAQTPNAASGTVLLHPFAIAGFVGLVSNALALLPIGNTDGGRISQSLFGRKWARVVSGLSLLILVLSGVFGLDEANILLSYILIVTIWQRNPEIPCRNEVDDIDLGRVFVSIAAAMLTILTLVPLP